MLYNIIINDANNTVVTQPQIRHKLLCNFSVLYLKIVINASMATNIEIAKNPHIYSTPGIMLLNIAKSTLAESIPNSAIVEKEYTLINTAAINRYTLCNLCKTIIFICFYSIINTANLLFNN